MSTSVQPIKALTEAALRQFINKALDRGFVRESFHCEHERADRNITNDDVLYGLERSDWVLAKPPDYDSAHKTWEYLIRTKDIEGDELYLKIAIVHSDGRVKVLTKY